MGRRKGGGNLGFEATLWQAADKLRGHMGRGTMAGMMRCSCLRLANRHPVKSWAGMPSKPRFMNMLNRLKAAGILKTLRADRGRRAQILALTEPLKLREGRGIP